MKHAILAPLLILLLILLLGAQCSVEMSTKTRAKTPTQVLLEEGNKFGANIVKSPVSPFLSSLAAEHANEVCRGAVPHDGFPERARRARQDGLKAHSEIVSRSWAGQTVHDGGNDAWKSWKASSSHWRTANGKPEAYGAAMIRDSKGRWVAVIIASWRQR